MDELWMDRNAKNIDQCHYIHQGGSYNMCNFIDIQIDMEIFKSFTQISK